VKKPLDTINLPATGWFGLAVIVLTGIQNPTVQSNIVTMITHPTASNIIGFLSLCAGGLLLWLGKPPLTSSAPPPAQGA
jgi:hypothetical protein